MLTGSASNVRRGSRKERGAPAEFFHKLIVSSGTLGLLSSCGPSTPDDDGTQFEIDCLAWQHKTAQQRYLDGPYFRDDCLNYLRNRTPKQVEDDQKFERSLIEDARKEWGDK